MKVNLERAIQQPSAIVPGRKLQMFTARMSLVHSFEPEPMLVRLTY